MMDAAVVAQLRRSIEREYFSQKVPLVCTPVVLLIARLFFLFSDVFFVFLNGVSVETCPRKQVARKGEEDTPPIPQPSGSFPLAVGSLESTAARGYFESMYAIDCLDIHGHWTVSTRENVGLNVGFPRNRKDISTVYIISASGICCATQIVAAGAATVVGSVHEGPEGGVFGATSGKVVKMFAIGLGSGFLAGVFGVGGGVVTVPALSLATDLGHKEVGFLFLCFVGG